MNKAQIFYYDIGDYLKREEKLAIIRKFGSISNPKMKWKKLQPNEHGDWINQRNDAFGTLLPMTPEKKFEVGSKSFFVLNSRGNETTRDTWVYNSSQNTVKSNMKEMILFYNSQIQNFVKEREKRPSLKATDFIDADTRKISWSSSLIPHLERGNTAKLEPQKILKAMYRPFFKQYLYFGEKMIHRRGQMTEFFPTPTTKNLVICVSGVGVTKDFSTIISDTLPDLELIGKSQCFPLYYYEKREQSNMSLFDTTEEDEYIRRDGVSDFILERAQKIYGTRVTKEDIFYYVYGILHSPDYRKTFANDLKKMLPRLPLVDKPRDFRKFSTAGRALADLHINYEKVAPLPEVTVTGAESNHFTVEKMRFPKKDHKHTIIYNSHITISNIPEKAYQYIINGKSAIEWIMERYQIKTDKKSGITNDPNDWAQEVGNERYILDLLLSIITVSVQTVDIVKSFPKLKLEQ